MPRHLISSGLIGSALLLGTALVAEQPAPMRFRSIDIGKYLPGVSATYARGVNAPGDIVGRYVDGKGSHGFLLSGGALTTIDVGSFGAALGCPSTKTTIAVGINPQGDIVGYCNDASGNSKGFLRYPFGGFIPIDFPASKAPSNEIMPANTLPIHITPTDLVVGCFHHSNNPVDWDVADGGTMYGFVYRDGNYEYLPVKGSMNNGITPDGRTVVGVVWPTTAIAHAYVVHDGVYQLLDLSSLGATFSYGGDINPSGEIVGYFKNPAGFHGFLLNRDGLTQIDYPGTTGTTLVNGINPQGDIVGQYAAGGKTYGFIATRNR